MSQVTTDNDRFQRFVEENDTPPDGNFFSRLLYRLASPFILLSKLLLNAVGLVLDTIQEFIGVKRMAYIFCSP